MALSAARSPAVGAQIGLGLSVAFLAATCVALACGAGPDAAWRPLFDGVEAGHWKPTPFGGAGGIAVVDGALRIDAGSPLNGVTWDDDFPRSDFEIALEARRVDGDDFFCAATFPVGDDACSLILGGWGGGLVGLSCIDGCDASENDTTQHREFERGRWYAVVIRVTPERITCLLDGEKIIDQSRAGHRISVRHEVAASKPLGIATYATTGEIRDIRWRPLAAAEGGP